MTEAEALKKWCPFVRVALMRTDANDEEQPVSPAYNRMHFDRGNIAASDGSERETLCIASACMAWRVQSVETKRLAHIDREGSVEVSRVNGYCGLAGFPNA